MKETKDGGEINHPKHTKGVYQFYKNLLDEVPSGILVTDFDHEVIYVNQKAANMLDSNPENLQGKHIDIELRNDGKYCLQRISKNGQLILLEIHTNKVMHESKELLLHYISDKTEERKITVNLQEKTHEISERNKELRALYETSRLTSATSREPEEVIRELIEILLSGWQFPEIAQVKIAIKGVEYISGNYLPNVPAKQSSPIVVNGIEEGFIEVAYQKEKVHRDEGPFLKEERSLLDNISLILGKYLERVNSEARIRFNSTLINSVGEAVISTDMQGKITFWNKAAEKLYGWNASEVMDQNIIEITPSDGMAHAASEIMQTVSSGNSWSGEFKVQRKSGEEFYVQVTNSPLYDARNNIIGVIGISRDISQRIFAENALKDSLDRLNNVAENIPGMIFQFKRSANGVDSLPFASGACRELFGVEPEDAMRDVQLLFDVIHPSDKLAFFRNIEESYRNLLPYKTRFRTLLSDNKVVWIEASSLPKKQSNGEIIWTGVALNITEFKKTEDLLKASEQRFYDISENLPGLVYQFEMKHDGSFSVPYISKSAEKVFGIPVDDLMDTDKIFSLVHQEDLPELKQSIYQSADTLSPWFSISRIHTAENKIKWIHGRSIPRLKSGGEILWNGVMVDITEQKQAEMAVKENEEKLREAQQMAEMGNFELILPERKIKWSVEIANLLGISHSTELVSLVDFRELIEVKDRWKVPHYVDQIYKTGESASFDLKITTGDSRFIYLHITGKPRKDVSGRVVSIIGTAMNITKRKTHEIELRKAKEKAEESDRLKSTFLQTMSHELRTPLNAVIGFSDLILDEEIEPSQYPEFIRLINNSGKHLLDIIEDIFEISALETGQSKPRYKVVELGALFRELDLVLKEEKKKRQKSNLHTRFIPLGSEINQQIVTDPAKLKRLLTNLLVNALKFTQTGSVEYGYKVYRSRVLFYVKDTGIGIPVDKHKIIFERFRQAEESPTREYEGVGLGLSICKIIAELLEGEIWVDSEPGSGSTFYFMLPVNKHIADSYPADETNSDLPHNLFEGKKVLLVEDEKSNMNLLELMLKNQGADILKAFNGKQALEIFHGEQNIDIILMDIKMPEMNGFEATREIRKTNNKIPVIALTAYAQEGDMQKAFEAGCSDYISKPLRKETLIDKMKFHLYN